MEARFRYKLDKRSKRITLIVILLALIIPLVAYFFFDGIYFPIWSLVTSFSLLIFIVLSIPLYLKVTRNSLEIYCVLDYTRINIEDIEIVRRVDKEEKVGVVPLLANYGFFGYFGYFFSIKEWSIYRVYTSSRRNRVLIVDIYESNYIVNCEDPERLINFILRARDLRRAEIFNHISQAGE